MTEDDWNASTTYYGPHDVDGRPSTLCADLRRFMRLSPADAMTVTVELNREPIVVPGEGPKLRLYSSDLDILAPLLPADVE